MLCKSINSIPLLMKMSFMVDLRVDIRTKKMLNITPCKKCCFIYFVNSKLRKTEIVKELKNESKPC